MLLEALDRLGCLDVAVDRLNQRTPVELFAIIEKTNQEVELRHTANPHAPSMLDGTITQLSLDDLGGQGDILRDLSWTLYSKFEAIAEGHRAVHDVITELVRRKGLRRSTALTGGFDEMWKLYQSEVRSEIACLTRTKSTRYVLYSTIILQPAKTQLTD